MSEIESCKESRAPTAAEVTAVGDGEAHPRLAKAGRGRCLATLAVGK